MTEKPSTPLYDRLLRSRDRVVLRSALENHVLRQKDIDPTVAESMLQNAPRWR